MSTDQQFGHAGDMTQVMRQVAEALRVLGADYYVGGSIASSTHGVMRATADIDVVVAFRMGDARRLVQLLSEACHGDADIAERSVGEGRPFNLIHLQTMLKLDFFPAAEDVLSSEAMARATEIAAGVRVATPEDIILAKLRWFRDGGEVSERQWTDVLGVMRARGPTLDQTYLDRMARMIGVWPLLERALRDA